MIRLDSFLIEGGRRLKGSVRISGSKNAALPCLFATLLTDEESVLDNVPRLQDIRTAVALLEHLGKKVVRRGDRL
ncbi:MAG: UDP-N-acetylglucosamine 1-carboxyvinyltransferase, partial [Elusimicrobiota bacterium]